MNMENILLFLATNNDQEECFFFIYTYLFLTTSNVFFSIDSYKNEIEYRYSTKWQQTCLKLEISIYTYKKNKKVNFSSYSKPRAQWSSVRLQPSSCPIKSYP